ncbi:MAG: hypothetical protein EZS28_056237, partial [Streblomastix strix]
MGLFRMLDIKSSDIILNTIMSISSIVRGGLDTTDISKPHPHYETIEQCNGLTKIFQVFRQSKDKNTKDMAAICFGRIHRQRLIKDVNQKVEIIQYLKSIMCDPDDWTKGESINALSFLALNS